jgi:flagellar basal body L-ring protein FlgH
MGVQFMSFKVSAVFATAAEAAAFLSGAAIPQTAAAAPQTGTQEPSLADKVRDFLSNDSSGFDWRSSKAIGDALGVTMGEVEAAVSQSGELRSKRSTRGMGVLIALS